MYRFLAVLQSFLAGFLTEYSARHCVHVDLKDALFPYYWCRQSLKYFSAPAGEDLGLRDSKSAIFKVTPSLRGCPPK